VVLIADRPGAKAAMTGKLFEYLATGLPTLVIGPADGEAGRLVTALLGGWVVAPHDIDAISRKLVELAEAKRAGELRGSTDAAGAARYERRALTGELAAILDELVSR
jgi:glycosyltransferase involved in cell wall biosynthesis